MPKKIQTQMAPHPSPEAPSSSSESTSAGNPDSDLRGVFAKVPSTTGCAFWGKVWPYGSKLHENESRTWLSFAIYIRQPGNEQLTVFVNWQDFTWVPEKKALVICQGTPILRTSEEGKPYMVLRCYGSKGVRIAYNTDL